jgi:hypothetical protein
VPHISPEPVDVVLVVALVEVVELVELVVPFAQMPIIGTQSDACCPCAVLTMVQTRPAAQAWPALQSAAQYESPPNCPHKLPLAQSEFWMHGGHATPLPPMPPLPLGPAGGPLPLPLPLGPVPLGCPPPAPPLINPGEFAHATSARGGIDANAAATRMKNQVVRAGKRDAWRYSSCITTLLAAGSEPSPFRHIALETP